MTLYFQLKMIPILLLFVLLSQFSESLSQNHVYHFIKESKTWSKAQEFCRKYYTDLATVNDATDLERLKRVADGKNADAWIGLYQKTDNYTHREWHWAQPGVKYNESENNWKEREPSDKSQNADDKENCVVVNPTMEWIDSKCDVKKCFICYNETSNTTVVINNKMRLIKAQSYCRENHTNLISGRDQLDTVKSATMVPSQCGKNWWIGLFRDTWGWSDGSDSSFRIWEQWKKILHGTPTEITKKCVTLAANGTLNRVSCDGERPFICYDNRFILVKENMTWEDALVYCRQHYRELAWFTGCNQRRMVQERAKMADSEFVWVGLHYTCFFEEWIWVTGSFVTEEEAKWETRRRSDDCGFSGAIETKEGKKWVKRPSDKTHNFICNV